MESKVNYALVGAFVLVLSAILICVVLWLAVGIRIKKHEQLYGAVIQESVAGLDVDAPVKYLGVDVGKVKKIFIDPHSPQQVQLVFAIEHGTLIKQDTVAVLKSQGLTGIAYVELSGGTANSPVLTVHANQPYPMIVIKPSLSARLENVLSNVLANLDQTSATVNAMFDQDNRMEVKRILNSTSVILATIAAQKEQIHRFIVDAAATANGTAKAIPKLSQAIDQVGRGAGAFEKMSVQLSKTSTNADQALSKVDQAANNITQQTLPKFDLLLSDLADLSKSLKRLSDQTEGNPNSLILGTDPVPFGPGESSKP
ncbi:MCE family protein [Sapientia aquatica]|uniref:MCE family protein n=1 Tax=Sapientia aquatica TaxID=1549640 RepID=A0A4R5W4W0_9BURK|nr:MCE family protein [Sapientia aquatica]